MTEAPACHVKLRQTMASLKASPTKPMATHFNPIHVNPEFLQTKGDKHNENNGVGNIVSNPSIYASLGACALPNTEK